MAFSEFSITMGPQEGVDQLNGRFDVTDGHSHDGTAYGGKKITTLGTLTTALHQPNPVTLASASGVLTLTEGGNSFIVTGTEAITSITGWTAGTAMIRWNSARTLTYNATSLILQGAADRTTAAGDVGLYEMTSAGAREVGYFPATAVSGSPTGAVMQYAGSTVPAGFFLCDGSAVSRTKYAALYAIIGTTYGTGDGSTTFNLPNLQDKFPLGKGSTYATLAATGGEATHTLTIAEMPNHTHRYAPNVWGGKFEALAYDQGIGVTDGYSCTPPRTDTVSTGGGGAHNNMPPYIVLNYIIKY